MKALLPLLVFVSYLSNAQSADFILLKHHNKTLETFYIGSNINFTTTTGAFITANINQIRNDSLYLQQFITRYLPTVFGTYILDTAGSYHYTFHYNQIRAIGLDKPTKFNWSGSGAALLGGGALLTLGSAVVYIADRNKFSAPLLISAVALGTAGYFMSKGNHSGIPIGKKYRLVYMNMSAKQKGK